MIKIMNQKHGYATKPDFETLHALLGNMGFMVAIRKEKIPCKSGPGSVVTYVEVIGDKEGAV